MPDADNDKIDPTGGTSVLGDEATANLSAPLNEPSLDLEASPDEAIEDETPKPAKRDRFAGVKDEAAGLRTQATERFYALAGTGKDSAVEFIDGYIQTIQDAATKVEEFAGPQVAQYVHQVADMAADFSDKLRESDVDELVDEARNLVRRSPAIAIGAAAAAGFALSRFLKATSDGLEPDFAAQTTPRKRADGAPAYDA